MSAKKTAKSAPVQSAPPINPRIAKLLNPSWYRDMSKEDARPDSMRTADLAMGVVGPTEFGRLITNVQESYRAFKGAGINTHNGLWFAWDFDQAVRYQRERKTSRAAAIKEVVRYLTETGAAKTEIAVNGSLQQLGFAMLATSAHSFDQIPDSWMQTHALATLDALRFTVERHADDTDDCMFHWKSDEWKDFARECLDAKLAGIPLDKKIQEKRGEIAKRERESARKGLTDEQIAVLDKQEQADSQEKKIKTAQTAIKSLETKLKDTGLTPSKVAGMLESRGMIPEYLKLGGNRDAIVALKTIGAKRLPGLIFEAFTAEEIATIFNSLAEVMNGTSTKSA